MGIAANSSVVTYNQFYDILRLFDVLPNFRFTTSETMCDYYLQTRYIRVALRVAEQLLRLFAAGRGNMPTQEKKKKDLGSWETRKYQEIV